MAKNKTKTSEEENVKYGGAEESQAELHQVTEQVPEESTSTNRSTKSSDWQRVHREWINHSAAQGVQGAQGARTADRERHDSLPGAPDAGLETSDPMLCQQMATWLIADPSASPFNAVGWVRKDSE